MPVAGERTKLSEIQGIKGKCKYFLVWHMPNQCLFAYTKKVIALILSVRKRKVGMGKGESRKQGVENRKNRKQKNSERIIGRQ